jgi:pimeloyl-ACP methyl ester carboxylesterase
LSLLREAIRKWYYYAVGAREFTKAQGVMRDVFKHVVAEDLAGYMNAIHVPCLLVWGEDDRITPLWIAKRMNECIQGSTLITIPSADHGVSYKEPALFMKAIAPFLKSL